MRKLMIIVTTLTSLLGLSLRAEADQQPFVVPAQTVDQLKKKCAAAGGEFGIEDWGGYSCVGKGGWAVNCAGDNGNAFCYAVCVRPRGCPVAGGGRVQIQGGHVGAIGGSLTRFPANAGTAGFSAPIGSTPGSTKTGTAPPSHQAAPTYPAASFGVLSGPLLGPIGTGATKRKPF